MLTAVFMALQRGLGGANWHDIRRPIRDSVIRWLLEIAFLPYEALLHLDAIFITLWRVLVSRRHLLQWTTAAHTVRLLGENVSAEKTAGQMLRSLILVSLLLLLLATQRPEALSAAAPFLILWVFASEIAHRISVPEKGGNGRSHPNRTTAPAQHGPAAPGSSLRNLSARKTTGCRPTTSRKRRAA
jgi:cyclic beta-1,2-glucan synthetase